MKERFFLITLAVFLSFGIYASLAQTFAQDGIYEGDTTPGSAGTITNQTTNTTGLATADEAFNPLWLLPLIAIPLLLYLLWPKGRQTESFGGHGYAGVKGGKARKDESEEEEYYTPEPPRYRDDKV